MRNWFQAFAFKFNLYRYTTRLNFEWEVIPPPESATDAQAAIAAIAGDGEYYAVHLPDRTILVRKIGRGEPHWMAFGREVLGHLLGCPERTSWQNCMEDEAAEVGLALFTAGFALFTTLLCSQNTVQLMTASTWVGPCQYVGGSMYKPI